VRGLLAALWSFLQHPAVHFEDHLTAVEERLKALEARLVGDLQSAVDTGVVAVEETIASVEHRLEQDFERTIRSRVAGIQTRLETVKKRVVEDLKHELHRAVLMLALVMSCAMLALVGTIFGLMAAWTELKGFIGAVGASLVLAIVFLLGSLIVLGLLRSVLHRSQPPPSTREIAT
jgi:biopolymer transport protein ExbB/TolQ